jgi:hypothetical protein
MTANRSRDGALRMEKVSLHLYGTEEESRGGIADGPTPAAPRPRIEQSHRGKRGAVPKNSQPRPAQSREPQSQERSIFVIAERLVQIWSSNEREIADLRTLRQREQRVRAYMSSPRSNLALGHACLERLEQAYKHHLARLCENRRELSRLLPRLDAELGSETAVPCLRSWGQTADHRRSLLDSRPTHCWYA